jgi:hypothetical protein
VRLDARARDLEVRFESSATVSGSVRGLPVMTAGSRATLEGPHSTIAATSVTPRADSNGDGVPELAATFAAADLARAFGPGNAGSVREHVTVALCEGEDGVSRRTGLDLDVVRATGVTIYMIGNPLHALGSMNFTLPEPGPVRIEVFEVSGRRAAVLLDADRLEAGLHQVPVAARGFRPGAYFYRLESRSGDARGRFVVLP